MDAINKTVAVIISTGVSTEERALLIRVLDHIKYYKRILPSGIVYDLSALLELLAKLQKK